jgi:glucokinase
VIIGIDLGGTHLRAAAYARGQTVHERRELVGEPRDPETIIARIAKLVTDFAGTDERVSVGVGIAAMLRDRRGTVANSPHLRWRDVAFGERLAAALGPRVELGVYNDVNAITWGEVSAGAARGCRDVLGVYIGTGIGAGVVVDGRLVEGATNTAGELGHTKVRWDDAAEPCACGQRGCLEAYLGGSYLERRLAPRWAFASDVDRAAAEGDAKALALWSELSTLFAVALANAVALLNPERVVLGGGVLSRCPLLYELIATALYVAAPRASAEHLSLVEAELGDDAGLIGSARLAEAGVSILG